MTTQTKSHLYVPKAMVVFGGAMIALAIVVAAVSRNTDFGATRADIPTSFAETRTVIITDRADGAVVITDAGSSTTPPDVLMPGSSGFVRVAVSGLAFSRQTHGIGKDAPFELQRAADDRMWLYDPATGVRVDLNAFGWGNRAVFAALLPSGRTSATVKAAP
jgi:putative photosynthetic complex assembly protein